jgi:hypothetical protein
VLIHVSRRIAHWDCWVGAMAACVGEAVPPLLASFSPYCHLLPGDVNVGGARISSFSGFLLEESRESIDDDESAEGTREILVWASSVGYRFESIVGADSLVDSI